MLGPSISSHILFLKGSLILLSVCKREMGWPRNQYFMIVKRRWGGRRKKPDADENIPIPPLAPRLQTLPFLTYLVDSTSKGNPGPLSPAEGHTPLPDLCLVTSRQDLVGQGPQHWPKDSSIPSTSSLCRDEMEGFKRLRELEENGLEFGVSKPQGIICNSDHLIPMMTL